MDRVSSEMKKNGFRPLFPPESHPDFIEDYYAASFEDPDHCMIEVYAIEAKS